MRMSRRSPSATSPLAMAMVTRKSGPLGQEGRGQPQRPGARCPAPAWCVGRRSYLAGLGRDEEAAGADGQDQRHHQVDAEELHLREEVDGGGADQADDERAERGALHASPGRR